MGAAAESDFWSTPHTTQHGTVKLWPHPRGFDCGPCVATKYGICVMIPCMTSEIPVRAMVNWQEKPCLRLQPRVPELVSNDPDVAVEAI